MPVLGKTMLKLLVAKPINIRSNKHNGILIAAKIVPTYLNSPLRQHPI